VANEHLVKWFIRTSASLNEQIYFNHSASSSMAGLRTTEICWAMAAWAFQSKPILEWVLCHGARMMILAVKQEGALTTIALSASEISTFLQI
jgi:hypothetical protein